MENIFVTSVGYILGILIVFVIAGICLKPLKLTIKLILNSVIGMGAVWLINFLGASLGIHIGINPITAVVVGALGLPGVILILLLQIFY